MPESGVSPVRRSSRPILAVVLAAALGSLAAASAQATCRPERRATVPVERMGRLLTVTAALDGKPARLVLDTGAERTVVSQAAMRELHLRGDPWVSTFIRGVGGVEWRANALLESFTLGGVPLRRRSVNPVLSLVVAPLPFPTSGADGAAGLLGSDYLSVFDLDLDLAAGTLGIYAMQDCATGAIPWSLPFVTVPATRPKAGVLLVPVQIDGRILQAELDTGAVASLVTARGAARLGLAANPSDARAGPALRGVGRQEMAVQIREFAEIRFGPLVLRDAHLAVGAPAGGYPFDMILGLDILRDARLWISYASNRVLVATPPRP